jgi:hypothetical protein
MTERTSSPSSAPPPGSPPSSRPRTPTARRRRPGPGAVIWGSVASFAALFAFLTYELGSGHDPALGAAATQAGARPQKVLVRRVIHRRVVTTVLPPASRANPGSSVSQSSAHPVVTAPAPAAPAPPAVTTSAS